MYTFIATVLIICAVLYCISVFRGGKAILEDYVFSDSNKTELFPRSGEVAVITGGARGIGVEVVKKLLQCDMHVVIGCRKIEAGNKALEDIRACGIKNGEVTCFVLDLDSFDSIRKFAQSVLDHFQRIDLLVNNAGIMFVPYALTVDGFERHFAVNYLGHCLLTHLLLPRMLATGRQKNRNCRVVNVSSCANLAGSIDFSDLSQSLQYIPSASYAQSKLAQVIFTKSLDSKLKSHQLPVQVHTIHPGIVNTDLFEGTLLKVTAPWIPHLFFKTPEQGAITIIHACLAPSLEGKGGSYLSNCRESPVNPSADSKKVQDRLWSVMLSSLAVEKFAGLLD